MTEADELILDWFRSEHSGMCENSGLWDDDCELCQAENKLGDYASRIIESEDA